MVQGQAQLHHPLERALHEVDGAGLGGGSVCPTLGDERQGQNPGTALYEPTSALRDGFAPWRVVLRSPEKAAQDPSRGSCSHCSLVLRGCINPPLDLTPTCELTFIALCP